MRLIASRSKLFTSGATPDRFAKAASSQADLVVLDLEDSVPVTSKASARNAVATALHDDTFVDRRCGVRINPVDGDVWLEDLAAVLTGNLDEVHVPKVEHPDQLMALFKAMNDVAPPPRGSADHGRHPSIVPTIETARGFLTLTAIADSTPLLGGLQLGVADLSLDTGIQLDDTRLGWFRAQVAVTAAAVGVPAWDPAHLDHRDLEGFRTSAVEARRWGMTGKSCVHPDQVAVANDVFAVTDQERERARRIVTAWDNATDGGLGAVSVDGQLVDRPVARAAQRLLDAP